MAEDEAPAEGKGTALRVCLYFLGWLLMMVPISLGLFFASETTVTVASHDARISPTLGNHVTIRTGPFLPDVRRSANVPLGVDVVLGKTEADSIEEVVQRYAFIASQPDAQVAIVTDALQGMALDSFARGSLIALVPIGVWALLGRERRIQLFGRTRARRAGSAALLMVASSLVVVVLVEKSWKPDEPVVVDASEWITLHEYLPGVPIPEEAEELEIQGTLTTSTTRRLVLSAIDTYEQSSVFYETARQAAEGLTLRQPAEDETVAVLVSDRHDNIGMDPVARAIGDRAGATVVLDAGDDTSTGSQWEAFSLDSLNDAFDDYERYSIQGNHDNGDFVGGYLADLGWTTSTDGPVDAGPLGTIASYDDPRSSGLGNWRDVRGLTIGEASKMIADDICGGDRVNTLVVHDVNMGKQPLARGCVDLVVAGHVHVQTGPDLVRGTNGEYGYRYTNGTTGGAAYAIAVGSKLRRAADVSLVTYRDGRPVGVQVVTLQTNNVFQVGNYVELDYQPEVVDLGLGSIIGPPPVAPDRPQEPGPDGTP